MFRSGNFLRVMYLVNYYVTQNSKKTKPNIEVFRNPRKNLRIFIRFLYMKSVVTCVARQ